MSVKEGKIVRSEGVDETQWFYPRWHHLYYCPFCGTFVGRPVPPGSLPPLILTVQGQTQVTAVSRFRGALPGGHGEHPRPHAARARQAPTW